MPSSLINIVNIMRYFTMELITYKVVIASDIEPIPFWRYKDYNPRALPTDVRALKNIQGYIRYKNMKLSLSELDVVREFMSVTKPTAVATNVTNYEFLVSYHDIAAMIEQSSGTITALGSFIGTDPYTSWASSTVYSKDNYVLYKSRMYRADKAISASAKFDITDGWIQVPDYKPEDIAKAGHKLSELIVDAMKKPYFENQMVVTNGKKQISYPMSSPNNMEQVTKSVTEVLEVVSPAISSPKVTVTVHRG